MRKGNSQVVNTLLIILGGGALMLEISGEEENVYILIIGIVLLMFGLFRATNHWTITKDDHIKEKEDEKTEDKNL